MDLTHYADVIKDTLGRIFPGKFFPVLFLLALLLLIFQKKNKNARFLGIFTLGAGAVFFFPPTALFLMRLMREGQTYWRYVWIIPYAAVGACAMVLITRRFQSAWVRILCAVLLSALVAYAGNGIYTGEDRQWRKTSNIEKLPQEAVDTVAIIHAHTEEGESVKLCAPMIPSSYIRQIDGTIEMPYGRLLTLFPPEYNFAERLYYAMEGNSEYRESLGLFLDSNGCNFCMTDDEKGLDEILLMDDFHRIGKTGRYTVWKKGA